MPKIMIDETLFAHITNDAFLTGSVSQSSASFQNTVGYLNQYLAEQDQIPQEVRCLSQACTQLIVYEEKISNINSVTQAMTIAKSIQEDINALPPNQYLLLPGGWALNGEQHRMVYHVKKDADGNVLFSICNSGEGITHHARRVDQDKERYNPLLTYRIPKENLAQKGFVDVLNKLILAQTTKITDRPKIRTDALYQSLFPKFAYVDGEIITDESLPYASVPLSKTSTQRSLHQLLKAQFPDVDSYRRFIYGFKAKALDDYIEQLLEKGTLNQHHTLLRQAIRHQLRLLTAFSSPSEEPLFDAPTTSREQEKLLSYLQTLTDAPKTTIAIVPTVRSTTTPTPMPRILQPTALYPAINPATALPTEDLADPIIPLDTDASLFYQLNAMLERGRSLAEKKQYRTLFNQLGDFFISLPLPTDARAIAPFYEEITSEERALDFYEKMNALQTLYFDSSQEILTRKTTSPRLYVVKLSIAAIANHISEAFPLTPAEPDLSRLLSENTAYMATSNLKWDKRYETLRQLPQKPSSHITPKNPHYYQSIIDKEPTLKAQLEELYTKTYANDVTLLHQNVRANKNTSLYYFTTHYVALSRDPSFSPLIKKFELQNQKERLWVVYNYITEGLYWSEDARKKTHPIPTISLSETETPWSSLSMTSLLTAYQFSALEPTPELEKSIYAINEATGAGAALKTRLKYQHVAPLKEDNVIQLTPTPYVNDRDGQTNNRDVWVTHVFTPQVLEDRELFHLRRNPRLQISLTLDYFNRQLEKLSDPNLQKYAEANLFEPGLLLTELEKNPLRFFDQFDAFIKNGLLHFARKGELTQPSLFFIRMAYLVNQYAAAYSPDYNERLKQYRTELCHHIDSQTNPMIITSLHQYRFQCILSMLPTELLENDITEALLSHFRTEAYSNPQHGLDIHSTLHYKEQKQSMVRILKGKRTQLTPELLRRICTIIGFPLPEPITITGQYPKFTVSNGPDRYTINVEQGRIFKGNMAYRNTPIDIQNHPITQQFGLQSCYSCFVSADESVYLLENRTESLRIIKYVAYTGAVPTYRVQKKWPSPTGAPEWYEFIPSSVDQANDWQVNQTATVALPKMLSDRDQLTWKLLTNNTYVLSDGNNIPSHDINAEGIITTRHTRRSLCQDDTWIHQRLQSFEDPNFVNVWQTQAGTHTVRLERYDLEWHIPHGEHTLHWSFEDNNYKLIAGGPTVGENISQVNVQQGDTVLCLLPVQRFISTDKRDGTNNYFELRQDTCARIPKSTQASNACWKHAHTERYLVLKIDPKTELPIPSTPEEALYLCYLYLGSHQPEKAWAVLGECDKRLGGLKGSYEELQYLQWIVKALPYPLPNDKATLSNPPYIACQLKALALLTHHNKKITIPKPSTAANTANGQYERNTLQEVSDFYNTIDSTIYTLFRSLQGMRRELPAEYELSDAERKSLLAHYHQSHDAMGALGYEWVQLHITALRQEEAVFNAKEAARLELTPYERQRQVDITTFLEKHEGVAKRYSQLEHRPIDLVIPTDLSVEKTHLSAETQTLLNMENFEKKIIKGPSTDESQTKAVSDLSLSMSDDAFIAHFKDYLTIIQNSQHRLHATVLHFCKATLIATRHVPLKKQTTLIPLLCNVLYRAGHQGGSIPNHIWSIECLIRAWRTQPPAITVPQLIDNTQQILTTAKALWDATPTPPAANPPSIISQPKSPGLSEELCTLQQQWHQIEQQFHLEKETLALSAGVSVSDSRDQSDDERVSGEQKYQALQTLQRFANEALQNESILENIRSTCESQIADLKNTQTTLLTDILRLGNAGPDDPVQNKQWHVNIAAGKRQSLSLNRLLTLYFHNDMTRYATETGLSADKIEQLHGQLTLYVANALQQQHRERVQQKLTELTHAHEKEKPQARFLLAQTLFAQNLVDVTTEPALSLFQYYENKWLRPSQKEALNRLLARQESGRFSETIEKMIMGGGKSKIVLPTLAEEKASGDNLVIIEVPRSLLHTNYVDLKATSATLFNQGCYLFEFDRDSDCSPEHLNRLYQQLNDVIVNKQYMVTTGESLQSLELKYLELLHTKPVEGKTYKEIYTRYNTWEQQVLAAERLVLLLRRKGDLIIDEVHQGLLLKTKLNYTLGDPRPIPKSILKHSIDLYQFFREIDIQSLFPEKESPFSLSEALLQRVTLTAPGLIEGIMAILTQQLITNTNSPLYQLIQGLQALDNDEGTNIAELIMHYLQNQSTEIPEVILRAPSPIQEKLAFFKEQISNLLPFTLRRHQGEHYGPSHIPNPLPQKRLLAIPYIANNVPNERSRFGNELESINYTIQSALLTGIEPDLLQTVLEDWLTQARTEVQKNPGMRIDDTVIAGTFRTIMGASSEITLNQLNLDDTAQLGRLYQQLRHDRDFIIEILRTHILPHIKANDNVLHSDSLNHVDLVHSCQGMTGTPWNHTTFHQRLQLSTASSLGTDAYVLKAIHEKKPAIRGIDFKNMDSFITKILAIENATTKVRAIIDINATFKGVSNLSVAIQLAIYLHQHKREFDTPKTLKYVLFFNEHNELSALPITADAMKRSPIIIGSSDPDVINARLNCTPAERFTYYDQAHTLGTDIKQAPDAKGLVLVDNDLSLQHFLQGSMRMRDLLEGQQTIDLIVPEKIQELPLDTLSAVMQKNEQEQLQQDNFYSALAKMRNLLRNDFMERLLHITGDNAVFEKQVFLTTVERYFIETDTSTFFERYGSLHETEDTSTLLDNYKDRLLRDWFKLLQQVRQQPTADAYTQMQQQMDHLVSETTRPGVTSAQQIKRKHTLAMEIQVEQQVEVSVLPKKEMPPQTYDPDYIPTPYQCPKIKPNGQLIDISAPSRLNDVCATTGAEHGPLFSEMIQASANFYQTYQRQTKYIDMYLKPVHALLFRIIDGQLQCVLLTQKECNDLCQQITDEATWWISTTQHTVLAGRPPEDIRQNVEYQSLIEQARYFNGEFNLLLTETAPSSW